MIRALPLILALSFSMLATVARADVRLCRDFFYQRPAADQTLPVPKDETSLRRLVDKVFQPEPSRRWWNLAAAKTDTSEPRLKSLSYRLQLIENLKPYRIESEPAREAIYRLAFENLPAPLSDHQASQMRELANEGLLNYFGSSSRALPSWQVAGQRLDPLFALLKPSAAVPLLPRAAFRHWMRLVAELKPREKINSIRGFRSWRETIHSFAKDPRLAQTSILEIWNTVVANADLIPDQEVALAFSEELRAQARLLVNERHRDALTELNERLILKTTQTNPLGVSPLRLLAKYRGEERGIWIENSIVTERVWLEPVYLRTREARAPFKITILPNGQFLTAEGQPLDTTGKTAIYGVDLNGDLYVKVDALRGDFHHSSFVAGAELLAAGEIVVINGRLTRIDNNSGHYHPDTDHLEAFANYLRTRGVEIPEGGVQYF